MPKRDNPDIAAAIALKQEVKNQSPEGYEIPDPTPLAPPIGYVRQPSITERIRDMVRSERLRQEAESSGAETFAEADDFDIEDDPVPMSGYENDPEFDPPLPVESTGVPSPSGEGKGQGGTVEASEPSKPAESTPKAPPAPASPEPPKAA